MPSTLHLLFIVQLALGIAAPMAAIGQQEPEFPIPPDLGFLRVINATGHPGKLWVTVNGVKLAAASGYEDGTATGAMGIQNKSLAIEMRHDTLGEVKQAVTLKVGVITAVIAVPAPKKADAKAVKPEEEGKPELAVHLLELPASRPDAPSTLTLIQFTPAAVLSAAVASTTLSLPVAKPQTMTVTREMGGFLEVTLQGKIIAQLNFKDPAGQGVVIYTDTGGVVKSTQFRNDVQ